MNPTPTPLASTAMEAARDRNKALKARTGYTTRGWLAHSDAYTVSESNHIPDPVSVVVLPFPTAKAAKAFCKVANMTHEERAQIVAKAFAEMQGEPDETKPYLVDARHALQALGLPKSP